MRRHLLDLRANNTVAWGLHLSFLCPDVVEFCGYLGFEWVFLDAEHLPLTHALCRDLVRAADVAGLPCFVRVPEIRASVIEGFLDAGVVGIVAPALSSASEARALVAAVKFSPEGERGSATRCRAANFGLTQTPAEYYRLANQTTVTAALIETQDGLDQLDEIMAVPGLDYVAIGPNDLALSLGVVTGIADGRIHAMVDEARAHIRASGNRQLTVVSDAEQARSAVAAGATLIAISDAALLGQSGRLFLDTVR